MLNGKCQMTKPEIRQTFEQALADLEKIVTKDPQTKKAPDNG